MTLFCVLSNDIRNNEEKIDENVLKYNMRHKRNIIDDVRYGSSSSNVSVDENGVINIHVNGTDVNIVSNTYYNLYFDTINGLFELGKTYYFTTGCLTKNCYINIFFRNDSNNNIISFSTQYDSYFTIPNNPEITKCIIRLHVKAGVYPDGVDEYCYPIITECDNIFDNKNDYSIKSIESYKDGSNNIDLNNIISSGSYIITSDINYTNYPNDENYDVTKLSILDVKSFFSKDYAYILQTIRRLNRNSFSNDIYFERLLTLSRAIKDATPSIYTDWKGFNIPENSSSLKQERYMFRAIDPQSDVEKYPEAIHGTYNSSGNIKPRTDNYWTITYERLCDNSRFMHGSGIGNISYYFLDEDKKVLSTNSFSTIPEGQNYNEPSSFDSNVKYMNYFVSMSNSVTGYFESKIFETDDPDITFDELYDIYDKYSLEANKIYYLPLEGESFSAANNNEEFIYDHKVFCSYDFTQFDHTENMYYLININSDGTTDNRLYITEEDQSQEEDPTLTWFIKPKNKNKWFLFYTYYSFIALFDENKNYITSIKALSSGYTAKTKTYDYSFSVSGYIYRLPWDKIDFTYIGINCKVSDNIKISSSPIYKGIIIDKKYGDIEFIGNKIINKPVFSGSLNFSRLYKANSYFHIIDKEYPVDTPNYDNSSFVSTDCIYLPAGTKIKCGPTGVRCDLRGIDNFEYDYHRSTLVGRDYVVPYDFYGHINVSRYDDGWNWSDKFNMSSLPIAQLAQFVQVISPDEQECNQWAGKHWYAYGTSITDIGPNDTVGNNGHSGKYPLYLDMVSGMIRHNGAIGSGGIYNKEDNLNYKKNILATPADADLVTIETLPNDSYTNETALGTIDDYTNDTILGNLNQCLDYLVNETHAKVVLIFIGSSSSNRNADDKKMFDSLSSNRKAYRKAVNMIKELAELYGIDVIDCDMHAWAFEQRGWGNLMADWIHPSHLGGWMLGRYIWSRLKQMQPNPKYPEIDGQAKSQFEYSNNTI